MQKKGKKLLEMQKLVDKNKIYLLEEAIELAKKTSYAKFDSSIDLAFKLNLDTRKPDQQLRGSVLLPHGTGKKIVILATSNDEAVLKKAKEAGANFAVDGPELENILKTEKFDFDIIVCDPKMMVVLGRYGKLLGPKGLMPNPKTGTVTTDLAKTVLELKKGKANYRTDKGGVVHSLIGKSSMESSMLVENAKVLINTIKKLKPAVVKGIYIQNLTVSATMGPSIKIEID